MRYLMIAGALALSLASSTTLAQTAQPSGQANQPNTTQTQGKAGMQAATTSTMTVQFVNVQPADVMAYNLLGTEVYNNQNENIGEIEDMVIDNGKTVRALIIGVGGFLGMGGRYVAVDPSTVTLVREGDDMRAIINTAREDLENAPTFEYERPNRR